MPVCVLPGGYREGIQDLYLKIGVRCQLLGSRVQGSAFKGSEIKITEGIRPFA